VLIDTNVKTKEMLNRRLRFKHWETESVETLRSSSMVGQNPSQHGGPEPLTAWWTRTPHSMVGQNPSQHGGPEPLTAWWTRTPLTAWWARTPHSMVGQNPSQLGGPEPRDITMS